MEGGGWQTIKFSTIHGASPQAADASAPLTPARRIPIAITASTLRKSQSPAFI
jgi:hypothetical protein